MLAAPPQRLACAKLSRLGALGVSIYPSTANVPCTPQCAPAHLAADDSISGPIPAVAISAVAIAAISAVAVATIPAIAVAPNPVATGNAVAVATCNTAVADVCPYAVRLLKRRRR